jgi:hypothetical protein
MQYRAMALVAASVLFASSVLTTQSHAKQKTWMVNNFRQGQTEPPGGGSPGEKHSIRSQPDIPQGQNSGARVRQPVFSQAEADKGRSVALRGWSPKVR